MSISDRLLSLVVHFDRAAAVRIHLHGLAVYVCPCRAVTQRHSLDSPHNVVALQMADEHQVQEENGAGRTVCSTRDR